MQTAKDKRRSFTRVKANEASESTQLLSTKKLLLLSIAAVLLATCSFWLPAASDLRAFFAQLADQWATTSIAVAEWVNGVVPTAAEPTAVAANAAQVPPSCFAGPLASIEAMTTGLLGKMLGTAMILMGGCLAVAKASPMPAIMGVAGGTFVLAGPGMVMSIMAAGGC